ncbi:MAG TPA: GNAT family N-acetyltransferase [Candidatus Saccharimonadales bacterium]|nr:GNAT family N-acetyltransferase [Candidatus Saccharimonadales bacterium]
MSQLRELFHIRPAEPADAAAIRTVYSESWIKTHADPERGLSAPVLRYYVEGPNYQKARRRISEIRRRIQDHRDHPERGQDYVAILDNSIVGYTSPRITKDGTRRVGALYVLPGLQGLGVGRRLLEANLAWHGPDSRVCLNVASNNRRARTFYEHHGFAPTGRMKRARIHGVALPQLEMAWQGIVTA